MLRVTDEELLAALQAGDMDSLGLLVLRWEQPLYRFVYRMVPRADEARDVCQETFLRILKKSDRFRSGSRFSTWMYQIALNLCRDRARRRKRWGLILTETHDVRDESGPAVADSHTDTDPEAHAGQREMHAAVHRALDEIPPEQREVLIMKEYEGLKFKEIAEILGCPESTVKSRMYYGLNGMRQQLARQGIRRA